MFLIGIVTIFTNNKQFKVQNEVFLMVVQLRSQKKLYDIHAQILQQGARAEIGMTADGKCDSAVVVVHKWRHRIGSPNFKLCQLLEI